MPRKGELTNSEPFPQGIGSCFNQLCKSPCTSYVGIVAFVDCMGVDLVRVWLLDSVLMVHCVAL